MRMLKVLGLASVAAVLVSPAFAFPPTATTSPGYDRALAESRKARQITPPPVVVEPVRPRSTSRVHRRNIDRH